MKIQYIFITSIILGIFILINSVSAADSSHINANNSQSTLKATKTINLTNTNYNQYFNSGGTLKRGVITTGGTLKLSGNFYNRNMTINIPLNIIGERGTLYNGTIKILKNGSGATISHINIKNNNQKGIILFESNKNTIQNNKITVNENKESYAIYLYNSNNNKIVYNNLTNTGNYITIGILLYGSNNNQIISNNVNTTGTEVTLPFFSSIKLNQDIGYINEIFPTYGILLLFSSNNNIIHNDVVLKSGFSKPISPSTSCVNSMVGIDIYYDSNNNTVTNNNIKVTGNNPFSYGLGVLASSWGTNSTTAENNVFSKNNVNVTGSYFATGFIAGFNSLNTILTGNTINVSADTYSYGVTLEASNSSTITKNTITTTAQINYAVELFKSFNNRIEENKIYPTGKDSLGIGTYNSGNNSILLNTIITMGDNSTTQISTDSIPAGNEGIKLYQNSNQNTIQKNIISSSAKYAINTNQSSNNTITNNYLISDNGDKAGDDAVTQGTGDTVKDNYGGSPLAEFTANITQGTAPLTVYFTNRSIGNITDWAWDFDNDGNVDSNNKNPTCTYTKPGIYTVKLTVTGSGQDNSKTVTITVIQKDTAAPLPQANIKSGSYKTNQNIKLTATDNQDPNPKIYYTTNGSPATIKSTLYTNHITINKTTILKFIAIDHTGNASPVHTATYIIDKIKPTIKINFKNGFYINNPKIISKISFSEKIKKGSGWIELKNSAGTFTPLKISISGNFLIINHLSLRDGKYILIFHTGSVTDLSGNQLDPKIIRFTVDSKAPAIKNITPHNNSTKLKLTTPLIIKFSENISIGVKYYKIHLKNMTTGKFVSIKKIIKGNILIIKQTTSRLHKNIYQLYIPAAALRDSAGYNIKMCICYFKTI